MTGVTLDLLTAILMIILAFVFGYSAGHRVGREETRAAISNLVKAANGLSKDKDDVQKIFDKYKGDLK